MAFTFTGPEQIAASGLIDTGSFYWQRPSVFLNGNTPAAERISLILDTQVATWQLRAFLRDNGTGVWTELDAGNGPTVSRGILGGLETPFGCPTYIEDPADTTKIICAYPRALDSSIAFVLFDKVAKTFGVPITGGPVVHGVDLVFDGSVSADDTGAKVCVTYRATDNKLLFIYQGPTEVVGAHTCLRPYYVTYDRTGAAWGVGVVLTGAAEDNPFEPHGIVIDTITDKAYATVIRPYNGKASPNNVTYQLYMVEISTADVFGAKVLMTDTVTQVREPLISYPVLRSTGGSFELLCAFVKGQTLATIKAAVIRGMVGAAPVFTEEDVSTDQTDAPGDGSFKATVGMGVDSSGIPYLFWFQGNEFVDFFYRLWYSSGGDAGDPWITPVTLFTSPLDDSTDFLDNGPAISVLDGIGSIGFGIIGFVTFLTGETDGVAYFEFIPAAAPATATLTLAKVVSPGGAAVAANFILSASGPTPISGAGGVGPSIVTPGVYVLSESVVSGYQRRAWSLSGTGTLVGNVLTLADGDVAVVTITNDPVKKPTAGGGTFFPRYLNLTLLLNQINLHQAPLSAFFAFPNDFDVCLAREWRLYNSIDRMLMSCAHKPECFDNYYQGKEWVEPPHGAITFNPDKSLPLPDPVDGDVTIFSLRVPIGYDGIVLGQYHGYVGIGTFLEGNGDIAWRVRVNGRYLRDMGNMLVSLGSPQQLSPCPGGLWLHSGNLVEYIVTAPNTSGALPSPGQGNILAGLNGFFFPRK